MAQFGRINRFARAVAMATVAVLVFAGCGSRRDEGALRAPLGGAAAEAQQPSEPQATVPAPTGGAPADSGNAAGTLEAESQAAQGGSQAANSPLTTAAGTNRKVSGSASPARPTEAASPAGQAPAAGQGTAGAGRTGNAAVGKVPEPSQPGAPAPAGSKDPLRIGMNGTMSGPVGAIFASGFKAVQAWAAKVNAQGGLNGHPVQLVLADDGADPARHRANSQRLVENEKVAAFVFENAPVSGQGSVSYIQEKRVPVIGSVACEPWVVTNSMYFPQISSGPLCAEATGRAVAKVALPENKKKIALFVCAEISGCEDMGRETAYKTAGFDVVYKAKVSLAQPDYTAQCLGARNAGAEVLGLALDTASVPRIADSCASVGFKPLIGFPSHMTEDGHAKRPNLDGHVVAHLTAPYFQKVPGIDVMRATMAQYAPSARIDGAAVLGWTSALLLERAGRNLTTATSAGLLEGLWSMKDEDIGSGLTPPLTYDKGAPNNGVTMKLCYWVARAQKGNWTTDGQRRCEPWDTKLLG